MRKIGITRTSGSRLNPSSAAMASPQMLERIPEKIGTQMPVHVADDPLTCVARGTGVVLEEMTRNPAMERVLVSETYARPLR